MKLHKQAKRVTALLLTLCILCGMLPALTLKVSAQAVEITSGTGSAENPVPIRTADELAQVGQLINSGSIWSALGVPQNSVVYYRLEADISLSSYASGAGWTSIGTEDNPFTGLFDGNGHTISGLTISLNLQETPDARVYSGMFGVVSGTVTGVTIQGLSIKSTGNATVCAGGIAGRLLAGGVIESCFVSGQLENRTAGGDGGIVGFLDGGAVRSCVVTASMVGIGSSGGLCGTGKSDRASGSVTGCAVLSKRIDGYVPYRPEYNVNVTVDGCLAWDGVGSIYGAGGFLGIPTKTAAELQTSGGWPEALKTAPWRYEEGKMPSLIQPIHPLPTYILGGFEGKGTAKEPYLISDLEGLALFAKQSRAGSLSGACFKLTANLDMNEYAAKAAQDPGFDPEYDAEKGWKPIRNFRGNFDGGGFAVQNLFIDRPDEDKVGFFGSIRGDQGDSPVTTLIDGTEGVIQNLGVENADVTGKAETGALLGETIGGQLLRCYSTGKVAGGGKYQNTLMADDLAEDDIYQFMSTGGLVGKALDAVIAGCYSTAAINGVFAVGGLAGFFWGTMTDCYTTGSVTSKYGDGVGGVLGMDHSQASVISRCYSTATVESGPLFKKRIDTWTGTGGVIGFGVGYLTDLIALNDRVSNNLPSETTTPDKFSDWVCYKVVGVSVQAENSSQKSWTGMELRGETKWRTQYDNNAAYFKTAGAWDAFSQSGEWTIGDGKLPTLLYTGGPQSSKPPLWFDDKVVDGYAEEPALKDGNRYEIWKPSELAWCGLYPEKLHDKILDIKADLDLSPYSLGEGWLPIGMEVKNTIRNLRVNGNGHTITGLTVNRDHNLEINLSGGTAPSKDANYGLFGRLENATIYKLHVRDAYFGGGPATHIGALAAYGKNLAVQDCSAESLVEEGAYYIGGLVGFIDDACQLIYNSAKLTVNDHKSYPMFGTFKNITVGGILGGWFRAVTVDGIFNVSNSWVDLKVSAANGTAGGIVGFINTPNPKAEETTLLSDCYTRAEVSFSSSKKDADQKEGTGGLIGSLNFAVGTNKSYRFANCYVTGSLGGSHTGGAIGTIYIAYTVSSDKASQLRLDNVVLLPEKIEGSASVGSVCGSNNTAATDGHLLCHFRSVTEGGKDKRFTQKLDLWNGTKYILDGAEVTTNGQLDDFLFIPYFGSITADKITSTYFFDRTDQPWFNKGSWSLTGPGALPTLTNLHEASGHIRQSNAIPLYILLQCTWSGVNVNTIDISRREELDLLSAYMKAGGETRRLNIQLAQSIDMGDAPFIPMGTGEHPFNGTFDGQGYSIRGLRVDTTATGGPAGLFGAAGPDSVIQNLALINPEIQGGDDVGALAGVTAGSVRQCYAAAAAVYPWSTSGGAVHVQGKANVGGLIGRLSGESSASIVEDCYTAVNVLAKSDNAGGLIGRVDNTTNGVYKDLSRCYTVGRVTSQGRYAGGIYGRSFTGGRLRLQALLVMSPSVMNSAGDNNCAVGGDTTAAYYNDNNPQTFVWEGLNATWNRTNPEPNPPLKMNMSEEDGYANLCRAGTWNTFMQFDPQQTGNVWLTADGVSAALQGFHDEQQSFVLENLTVELPTLKQDGAYYLICSARDWEIMGRLINEQPQTYADAKYRLEADISFGSALVYRDGYVPVGRTVPFTGELNGNGRTITFDPATFASGDIGLFGILGDGAYIHDLTVNASVENTSKSTQNTAAVAAVAQAGSTLENITVTGAVKDTAGAVAAGVYRRTGGLAGTAAGEIVSCQNRATVSGGYYTGGLAGYGNARITSCVNDGSVESRISGYQGGIIGFMNSNGTASLCANRGGVSGNTAGGIAGRAERTSVERSYSTGPVIGSSYAGGIVGYLAEGTLQEVYATGAVTGGTSGGIAGLMDKGSLRRGYATGEVKGSRYSGGIVGTAINPLLEQTAALNIGIGENGSRLVGSIDGEADYSQNNYGLDTLMSRQPDASYTGQDVTREALHTASFWTDTLGLSADLWDIPTADTGADDFFLPTLKSLEEQADYMPLHLKLYAREENTSLELTADKTQLWSPKGAEDTVVVTADITGTTQRLVEWSCSDEALTVTGGMDENGNPIGILIIPEGYKKDYAGGEVTVTATLSANSDINESMKIEVKARQNAQAPAIEMQPKDTSTVVGKPVTLTVRAASPDGGALSYQWYKAPSSDQDGTMIAGATEAAYAVQAAQTESSYYYCVVTNTIADSEGTGNPTASVKTAAALVAVGKDTQTALTIVGENRTVTYGDEGFPLQVSGGSGSGEVTWESSGPSVVSVDDNGAVTIHKAYDFPVTITATKAGDDRYTEAKAQITITVNKAKLTVKANDATGEYGAWSPLFTYTYSGFVKGEDESVLWKKPIASCKAALNSPVGEYPITLKGGEAQNYWFDYQPGTLTITKAGQIPLSILQGTQLDKMYGDAAFSLSVTGGSGNGALSWQSSDEAIASVAQDGKVTIHKSGEVTITVTKAADGPYLDAQAFTILRVKKVVLTVTAEKAEKYFGEENPPLRFSYQGFVYGENESVLTKQPTVAVLSELPERELPVGSYVLLVSGGEAENYEFRYENGILVVNKANQSTFTIAGGNPDKIYGDAPFALTTRNGAGGVVTWQSADEEVATVDVDGTVTIVGVGKTLITAVSAATANFEEASAAVTLTVQKKKLTIRAEDKTRPYGEQNPPFTLAYSGFVNGDGAAELDELPQVYTTADGQSKPGEYPLYLRGGTDRNYDFELQSGVLTVTAAEQSISILQGDQQKTYGDAPFTLNIVGGNGEGAVTWQSDNPSVAAVDQATGQVTLTGAGKAVITAKKAGGGNYLPSQASITVTVEKATLTITAEDKSRAFGEANRPFSLDYTGFAYGEDESILRALPIVSTTAKDDSLPGEYPITIAGGAAANYNIVRRDGTLTVTKANQQALTIVGGNRIVTYGDDALRLQTSGGSGAGEITWHSGDPSMASVGKDGVVTVHKASDVPVTITASKAGDNRYLASAAQITVTVNKARLTVTAEDKSREYGAGNPPFTILYTGFVRGENASVLTKQPFAACSAGVDAAVGSYPITVTGGEAENYWFDYQSGTLTVEKAGQTPLSILQGGQIDKTYGDAPFTLSVTGGSGNGAVTWESTKPEVASVDGNGAVTLHGAGTVEIIATKAADGSYVQARASTLLTVQKAVLTVTAANAEKIFGERNPGLTYAIEGFVNGENSGALTKQPKISVDSVIPEKELPVGSYVLLLSGGEAENYSFIYENGILVVNRADQSTFAIVGGNPTKTYGDQPFTLTTKNGAGGAVVWHSENQAVATVDENGRVTIVGAGRTQITAVSMATENYEEASSAVTLTVEKAELQVNADAKTRYYGEDNPEFTYTFDGFVNGEDENSLDSLPVLAVEADKKTGVGGYAIRLVGGEDRNYLYVLNNAELTIAPRLVTVQADDKEMTEGDEMPALTWTIVEGSIVNDDDLGGSLKADGAGVGQHPIREALPFDHPNYEVKFLPGILTVAEKPKGPEPNAPNPDPPTGDSLPAWPFWMALVSLCMTGWLANKIRKQKKEA